MLRFLVPAAFALAGLYCWPLIVCAALALAVAVERKLQETYP